MTADTAPAPQPIIIGESVAAPAGAKPAGASDTLGTALNYAFLLSTVAGCIGCFMGGVWGTIGACAAMFGYFFFGLLNPKSTRNSERFADSLYYQGFILTLLALLVSMTLGRGGLTSAGFIEKFGFALWTTFFGMSFRILTIQFRPTVADQEDETRESIAKYVAQLNAEITSTMEDLKRFKTGIMTSASDLASAFYDETKRSREETADAIRAINKELPTIAGRATARIDAAVKQVAERIEKLDIPMDSLTGRLNPIFDSFAEQALRLQKSLSESSTEYSRVLQESAAILGRTRDDLARLEDVLKSANTSIAQAQHLASVSLEGSRGQLAEAASAGKGIEELGRRANLLAEQLGVLWSSLDAKARVYGGQIDGATAEMRATAEKMRLEAAAATAKMQSESTSVAEALTQGAARITAAIRDAQKADDDA
ncbi:MAG: hypothetical protein WDM91_04095 [Rhizomicrobium sp.]